MCACGINTYMHTHIHIYIYMNEYRGTVWHVFPLRHRFRHPLVQPGDPGDSHLRFWLSGQGLQQAAGALQLFWRTIFQHGDLVGFCSRDATGRKRWYSETQLVKSENTAGSVVDESSGKRTKITCSKT